MRKEIRWMVLIRGIIGVVLLISCSGGQKSSGQKSPVQTPNLKKTTQSGTIQENRSEVLATVLKVFPEGKGEFRIRVRIDSVFQGEGERGFAKVGDTLEIRPKFQISEGQRVKIDLKDPRNQQLLQAGTLKGGEKVKFLIELSAGPEKRQWLFYRWHALSPK